jgi:hypothetical protein
VRADDMIVIAPMTSPEPVADGVLVGARKKPRLAGAQGCELCRTDAEFLCALSA